MQQVLFHEWLLIKAKEEREMEKQLNLALGPMVSTCAQCHDLVHGQDVVIKQYHTGHMTDVEHFCSNECHHTWYVNRLRAWGM